MKNLEIYLDDDTKVFECIISNHTGIVKIHHSTIMSSLEALIQSVVNGEYKIEFEHKILDTSKADTIFDRIELFKNEENFKILFDVVTPQKVLEYVYKDNIPLNKDIKEIVKFFNIKIKQNEKIKGIGEALFKDNIFIINYKEQYYKQRERFTIAHELGHIFLHFATDKRVHFEDYDDELEPSNDTNYSQVLKAARNDLSNYNFFLEKEADIFARDILIPAKQLEECINDYEKKHKTKPYMCYLKNEFGVSNGTIFYALKAASLLHKVVDDCRWW
jgi:Zn-dependent peptidase ImmA (M78 family)